MRIFSSVSTRFYAVIILDIIAEKINRTLNITTRDERASEYDSGTIFYRVEKRREPI